MQIIQICKLIKSKVYKLDIDNLKAAPINNKNLNDAVKDKE